MRTTPTKAPTQRAPAADEHPDRDERGLREREDRGLMNVPHAA
jgi:hypothetical protein